MGKFFVILVIGVLGVAVFALGLIAFTPLGVSMRYEANAPADLKSLNSVIRFPDEVFGLDQGYTTTEGGGGGSSEDWPDRKALQWSGSYSYEALEPSKADVMKKLFYTVLALDRCATEASFALTEEGLYGRAFGDKGDYGPTITWSGSLQELNSHDSSGLNLKFPGTARFAYVCLDYISPKNPGTRFRWAILCDRKEASFQLFTDYFAVSPLYAGSSTPRVGCTLHLNQTNGE